jgi:hypothetical protein
LGVALTRQKAQNLKKKRESLANLRLRSRFLSQTARAGEMLF